MALWGRGFGCYRSPTTMEQQYITLVKPLHRHLAANTLSKRGVAASVGASIRAHPSALSWLDMEKPGVLLSAAKQHGVLGGEGSIEHG